MYIAEALFIASRWPYHATFAQALRLFAEGTARHEPWGPSHVSACAVYVWMCVARQTRV